jgi:hypothetical protein
MKILILLLLPVLAQAQFYHFKKGERFTIKESRWVRLSNKNIERLKPSCQLLGISEIKVIKQKGESVLFKVLKNRSTRGAACEVGQLVQTNDIMADSLRINSKIYWERKNKIQQILKGHHKHTKYNAILLGDTFSVPHWEWAVVEEDFKAGGKLYYETMLCRVISSSAMVVTGFLAETSQILLEYKTSSRDYAECPSGVLFTKPMSRFF